MISLHANFPSHYLEVLNTYDSESYKEKRFYEKRVMKSSSGRTGLLNPQMVSEALEKRVQNVFGLKYILLVFMIHDRTAWT